MRQRETEVTNKNLQSSSEPSESTPQRKHATYIPTDTEEKILKELEEYKDSSVLPPDIVNSPVKSLSDIGLEKEFEIVSTINTKERTHSNKFIILLYLITEIATLSFRSNKN